MTPGLSVVVMAFNEAGSVIRVIRELHAELLRTGRDFEIVVVDDGSSDGTGAAAERLLGQIENVRVVRHAVNGGLGEVYRTGLREARKELITFFPADGQFPATIASQFLDRIPERDLILGYVVRRSDSRAGRVLSWVERVLYRLLFGELPRFQGLFMLRRAALARMPPLSSEGRGWVIVMEMIVRAVRAGLLIESVETPLRPRMAGRSKVQNLRTIVANMKQLVGLAWRLQKDSARAHAAARERTGSL